MPTGWGFYLQGSDEQLEVEELGGWLSLSLKEPVHYPAWGKPIFECKCGVLFPLYAVNYFKSLGDVKGAAMLVEQHEQGYKPIDGSILKNGMINRSVQRYDEKEHLIQ
jgi:hypothetical protein